MPDLKLLQMIYEAGVAHGRATRSRRATATTGVIDMKEWRAKRNRRDALDEAREVAT